jgi:hypothetical protein
MASIGDGHLRRVFGGAKNGIDAQVRDAGLSVEFVRARPENAGRRAAGWASDVVRTALRAISTSPRFFMTVAPA